MKPKISANERRLAKLLLVSRRSLLEAEEALEYLPGLKPYEEAAAYLAKRGVLAVCAETVPDEAASVWQTGVLMRNNLRRLARGTR